MIPSGKVIACDTETTGINFWLGDRPFCFTFCNEEGKTGAFYWSVNPWTREVDNEGYEWAQMKEFFEDASITKIFHNAKFDLFMLEHIDIRVRGRIEDTLLMSYVLKTNAMTHALKPLAKEYLSFPDDDEKDLKQAAQAARREGKKKGWMIAENDKLHGKNPVAADYWLAPKKIVLKYAVGDVERTMLLWKMFKELLEEDKHCAAIYERDLVLMKAVMDMERRGVRVSIKSVKRKIKHHKGIMRNSIKMLREVVDHNFNPNSGKQIARIVYEKLKFPCSDFTDKGNMKTGSKILRKFKHPIINQIIAYQSSQKAISVFYKNFLLHARKDKESGEWIIHPWYNLNGTDTGRFSCNNPNLQNVADANTTQALVPEQAREPFKPRKGYVWFSFDYSGQELWIYANNARDEDMIYELRQGSPHLKTARSVWPDEQKIDEEKEVKTVYKRAKILLFSIIFGSGVKGIVDYHNMSYSEAKRVHAGIHKTYPGIQKFIDKQSQKIRERGYILTPYGRKIVCDSDMGYKSANYSVQGTAGDVMKKIIIRLWEYFKTPPRVHAQILMTIHDELIIEIPKEEVTKDLIEDIRYIMEDQPELKHIGGKLPTGVAIIERNWAEKREIKDLKELDK